jgi:hypothetical protein
MSDNIPPSQVLAEIAQKFQQQQAQITELQHQLAQATAAAAAAVPPSSSTAAADHHHVFSANDTTAHKFSLDKLLSRPSLFHGEDGQRVFDFCDDCCCCCPWADSSLPLCRRRRYGRGAGAARTGATRLCGPTTGPRDGSALPLSTHSLSQLPQRAEHGSSSTDIAVFSSHPPSPQPPLRASLFIVRFRRSLLCSHRHPRSHCTIALGKRMCTVPYGSPGP